MSANPLTVLYSEMLADRAVDKIKQRAKRQVMLEGEIATFRPDFWEAKELLEAFAHGIAARMNLLDSDELPENLQDAFKQLDAALSECDRTGAL
jgi:hypothetical protein